MKWLEKLLVKAFDRQPLYAIKYLEWCDDRIRRLLADLTIIEKEYKEKRILKKLKYDKLYNQYLGKLSMLLHTVHELKYPIKLSPYAKKQLKNYFEDVKFRKK